MQYHAVSSSHVYWKTLSCLSFSSIGGHSEQESTLNQLLVEMDGELNPLYTADLVLSTGLIMWIGHRKEIRKLTFRALALRRSQLIKPHYPVILSTDAALQFL